MVTREEQVERKAQKLEANVEATRLALLNTRIVLNSSYMAICSIRETLATAADNLASLNVR
jgi:hypothetical protein